MKTVCLSLAFILLINSQVNSQFQLKGEFRPRIEYRSGYGEILSRDENPILTISERARLSAYYETGILSFGFAIQDVRVWGDDDINTYTGSPGSNASIDLNEGWIGIKPYSNGLLKVGRQYLIYEDERILSSRGWNQSEIKYNAVLFRHGGKTIQVDAGFTWNNLNEKYKDEGYPADRMKTLEFIYLKKNLTEWMYLSAIGVASGFNASDTSNEINNKIYLQGTYALYFVIQKGKLKGLASGYYQNGRNRNGLNTNAYMFSIKADYLVAKKITIGAGIDYLSGNNYKSADPNYSSKNHSFDVLFGVRHRNYGHLDYFNNLPKSTGNGGLSDVFLKFNAAVFSKANLGLDLHYFSLQNHVKYGTPESEIFLKKALGTEADFYFSWDPIKWINVRGGYSLFAATDSMEKLQGVDGNARFPTWLWIMVTAKAEFLNTIDK